MEGSGDPSDDLKSYETSILRTPIQLSLSKDAVYHETLVRYSNFCSQHSIPSYMTPRGLDILKDILSLDLFKTQPKLDLSEVFASITYMAVVETRLPYGPSDPILMEGGLEPPSISVTDILRMADININKLFQTMDLLKKELPLSKVVSQHLTRMVKNYCVVSALFHSFQGRLCSCVFREDSKSDGPEEGFLPPIPESEGVSFRKKQCWLLFLLSKYNLMPESQELAQHFQLLLCCLEFVLRQTPSFLLNSPYDSLRFGCFDLRDQENSMLVKLAEDFDVDADETLQLHREVTESYFQTLLNKDGELESDSLCEEYEKIYQKEGDVDEKLFLNKDSHLLPLHVNRVGNMNPSNAQPKLLPEAMTPVRAAISSVQLLQRNFAGLPEEPSNKLKSYFQKCSQDPSGYIAEMTSKLREKFLESYKSLCPSTAQSTVAEQRFSIGVKLYLKVLETTLNTDPSKLSPQVLNTLLNKEIFHKSLLACALEVVIITYGQSWNHTSGELSTDETVFSFPWILGVFSLHAYDFYKVVESFIKNEPKLPIDVVKHLQGVEFRILESLAWKEDSPLFDVMGEWDIGQVTPPIPASPIKIPEGSTNFYGSSVQSKGAVDLFLSPMRPSHQTIVPTDSAPSLPTAVPFSPSKQPSPTCGSGHAINENSRLPTPVRSTSLSHFLNRVGRLGYSRLSKLCFFLDISNDLLHKIWTCFEYCVTKMPSLLKNRHIDQIILCCIYGISRVVEQDIRFKDIVNQYKNLPNAKQEVYKDVYINRESKETIISFYNSIFMPNTKLYILQFSPNKAVRPQLSPMPKHSHPSPSYSLPGKKNFIISPLRESPFKAPLSPSQMTPSSRLLFSFGDSIGSSEKLKGINEKISARSLMGLSSAKKRLNMDQEAPSGPSKARRDIL